MDSTSSSTTAGVAIKEQRQSAAEAAIAKFDSIVRFQNLEEQFLLGNNLRGVPVVGLVIVK